MGNDTICQIVGIGSIRFKVHNGKVILLTDVRHISGLKRNLISISQLDKRNLSYKGSKGVIEIYKNDACFLKGHLSGGLYYLEGIALSGNVNIISHTDSLWHDRMGHIGMNGLKYLCNKGLIKSIQINNT